MKTFEKFTKTEETTTTTVCILDYPYFKENYKLIKKGLSKQEALGDDPKLIQKTKFTGILERTGNTTIFFILEEAKETILDFCKRVLNAFQKFTWY